MHHVEFRDSIYVQTLTEDDMVCLKITDKERIFSTNYVIGLNYLYNLLDEGKSKAFTEH